MHVYLKARNACTKNLAEILFVQKNAFTLTDSVRIILPWRFFSSQCSFVSCVFHPDVRACKRTCTEHYREHATSRLIEIAERMEKTSPLCTVFIKAQTVKNRSESQWNLQSGIKWLIVVFGKARGLPSWISQLMKKRKNNNKDLQGVVFGESRRDVHFFSLDLAFLSNELWHPPSRSRPTKNGTVSIILFCSDKKEREYLLENKVRACDEHSLLCGFGANAKLHPSITTSRSCGHTFHIIGICMACQ